MQYTFFNENIELIVMCNLNDINDESIYVYCAQYFEIHFRFESNFLHRSNTIDYNIITLKCKITS